MNNYHNYYILYLTKEKEDEKKNHILLNLLCIACERVFKEWVWKSIQGLIEKL